MKLEVQCNDDEVWDGTYRAYFPGGRLKEEGQYINDGQEGIFKFYDNMNQFLKREEFYVHGECTRRIEFEYSRDGCCKKSEWIREYNKNQKLPTKDLKLIFYPTGEKKLETDNLNKKNFVYDKQGNLENVFFNFEVSTSISMEEVVAHLENLADQTKLMITVEIQREFERIKKFLQKWFRKHNNLEYRKTPRRKFSLLVSLKNTWP